MESLPKDIILKFNNDTLEVVRKLYHLNKEGEMKNAVNILEKWVKEQKHLTKKDFDRRYLETTIIVSKGSIERAKSRIDKSCTLRTLIPNLFAIYDVKHLFETVLKDIKHTVLPRMTTNHERVYLHRNAGIKFESNFVDAFAQILPMYCEYIRLHDYAASNYIVLDYMELNLTELVKAIKINVLQEIVALLLDCCGFRLRALYIISSSKFVDMAVALTKQVLSPKLAGRVHVLKNRESVINVLDKDILPKEYGGNEKPLDELHEDWLNVLYSEDYIKYLKEINSARTDESLRQRDTFNEQYMGMPGTFRTISVD